VLVITLGIGAMIHFYGIYIEENNKGDTVKDTKQIVAMVIDTSGNYVSLAARLASEYKRMYYCIPSWVDAYPSPNKTLIGEGIDGLIVVKNPYDVYDEIDLWIFPDVYYGAFGEWLKAQGEIVWGSCAAEELEIYRDILREEMPKLGLPVAKWVKINGMTALREYLQKNKKVWVKVNEWRGLIETFYSKNYDLVKPELDDIEFCRGILAERIDFICEEPIETDREMGYDGYTVDGEYPAEWLSGLEVKDKVYLGQWRKYSDLPSALTDFNTKFAKEFNGYGYRGFFSLENRIAGKKSYMTDFTARMPCPPGSIYLAMIENLGEVMWAGANGEIVPGKPVAQYGVELMMESNWAEKHICNIYFPKEIKQFVQLKKYAIEDGITQIIPIANGSNDIGSIVGLGKSAEEAIENVKKYAEQVEGTEISVRVDCLDGAAELLTEFQEQSN